MERDDLRIFAALFSLPFLISNGDFPPPQKKMGIRPLTFVGKRTRSLLIQETKKRQTEGLPSVGGAFPCFPNGPSVLYRGKIQISIREEIN